MNTRNGYRRREWDTRAGTIELAIPKLRTGQLLPGLAAGAPPPRRGGAGHRGGHLLPAGGVHPADGEAGRDARASARLSKSQVSEMAKRPRRAGGGVPHPAAGRRPVHLRGRRRAGAQGPRGRPHGQRARAAGDRGERRRLPGDPRPAGQLRRGRRRLAGVLPRPGRPRPVRGRAGHLRRPPRPGRRDRRDPARRVLADDAARTTRRT